MLLCGPWLRFSLTKRSTSKGADAPLFPGDEGRTKGAQPGFVLLTDMIFDVTLVDINLAIGYYDFMTWGEVIRKLKAAGYAEVRSGKAGIL